MGETKLCYGCFEPLNDEEKCPCGYKEDSPYSPTYLAPGIVLKERYMVGKLISHNGEGASYLGYDTVMNCKITLREYMPDALCTRTDETSPAIKINHNSVVQYKSLMEGFADLNKKLAKLRSQNGISSVLDLFTENNTTYVVYEYIDGVDLKQYLKDNAGTLSWKKISKMFPPFFTSVSMIHNAGIIHRGISPSTIYVTAKGELKLTDFCIAPVRTTNTELNSEIFKGYAAPEQYSPSSRQGTWTDIYGICAVLYRAMTGSMPTEASLRSEEVSLTAPKSLNNNIPKHVSEVILEGMEVLGSERIQDITELVTKIFEPEEPDDVEAAPVISEKSSSEEDDEYDDSSDDKEEYNVKASVKSDDTSFLEKVKVPALLTILLLAVIIIIVIFIKGLKIFNTGDDDLVVNLPLLTAPAETTEESTIPPAPDFDNDINNIPAITIADVTETTEEEGTEDTEDTSETDSATAQKNIQMNNVVGMKYEDLQVSSIAQMIDFEVEYTFSESVPRGQIISQSVKEGVWVAEGEKVIITVCKGDGSTTVPDYKRAQYSCYPIDDYLAILDDMGIKYRATPVVNTGYLSGYVIGTEPRAGEVIDSLSGDVLEVTFTDNSGGGSVRVSPGVSVSAGN